MPTPSVFQPEVFQNPANLHRPLQIIHGLDSYLGNAALLGVEEAFPAEGRPAAPDQPVDAALPDLTGLEDFLRKLARLGTGGIVTNVGFQDYLTSPRQWAILRAGLKKAVDLGLRIWIYDEKGYPSGAAGGIVTRANPELTSLGLACYPLEISGPTRVQFALPPSCRRWVWSGALASPGQAVPETVVDLSACVDEWGCLDWNAPAGQWTVLVLAERIMYEGTHAAGNVSEFKQYINLLNPAATRAFLRVTHQAYRRELPDEIWSRVEAIFTDEPSLMTAYVQALPERFWGKIPVMDGLLFQDRPMAVPWVEDFLAQFQARMGYDLRPGLFALFFSQAPAAAQIRQDYFQLVSEICAEAFYGQIQDWCQQHGVAASGHVLLEETINDHAPFEGSLFAALRRFDLPGIDMLNSDPQDMLGGTSPVGYPLMTIKQVSSVAHLTGCPRVHSESSDWEQHNRGRFASLEERIGQANLQYVLGVNQITSYFSWNELDEESWKKYNDYVGRLSSLLTGGVHVCDVAVLYPIRSVWAHSLPPLQPVMDWSKRVHRDPALEQVASAYPRLVKQLLCSQIDLDIIDEQAVQAASVNAGRLQIGGEAYRAVVLPPWDCLETKTVQALRVFMGKGGIVLDSGPLPGAAPAQQPAFSPETGGYFQTRLEGAAEVLRGLLTPDLSLTAPDANILYTHRVLESRHVYFITNNAPTAVSLSPRLAQPGPFDLYRPLTGAVTRAASASGLALAGYEGIFLVQ
jgi:hypothetical protein